MKHLIERLLEPILKHKKPKVVWNAQSDVYGKFRFNSIDESLLESFILDRDNETLYKSLDFLNESESIRNIFEYLRNPLYIPILKTLFLCKPSIGSPNAATGEFEIALLVTLPNATKPKKGDIFTPYTDTLNLKNDKPRIYCGVRGKELNSKMKQVLDKYGVLPKIHNGVQYGQLFNKNYVKNHFNNQFTNLNLSVDDVSEILSIWLKNLYPEKFINETIIKEIIEKVISGNQILWDKWLIENMVFIFEHSENRQEKYVLMKENGQIFCLPQNVNFFRNFLETKKLTFKKDFFRLNQDGKCGFYFSVVF